MKAYGAFQKGIEDARIGMRYWPVSLLHHSLSAGVNANLLLPIGSRTQETYYNALADSMGKFSIFQLKTESRRILYGRRLVAAYCCEL